MKDTVMTHDIAPEFDASASPEFDASALNEENTNIADEEIVIDDTPKFDFDKFGFDKTIIRSIRKEGFTTPTPIQDMAILPLMSGLDLMGIAQTGSGKTAAFSLPVMNKLIYDYKKPEPHKPKVLILAPTRELVMQIGQFIETFSRGTPIKNLVVAGGQPYQPQIRKLKYGVDILIATPGRLIDHMGSGTIKLDQCHTFILDEADRMLDMGFIRDIRKVVAALPIKRQTLFFSATMPTTVAQLAKTILSNPARVDVDPTVTTAEKVDQYVLMVPKGQKRKLLASILQDEAIKRAIVFTRTKHGANRVSKNLDQLGIKSNAIHGNKSQNARQKALAELRDGDIRVLVATDVAARGIDVDGITHVINFDLPNEPESYIHRIGRTARAGATGVSLSFCDHEERGYLRDIEKLIKQKISVMEDHPFHLEGVQPAEKGGASDDDDDDRRPRRSNRPRSNQQRSNKPGSSNSGSKNQNQARSRRPQKADGQSQDRPTGPQRTKKAAKKHYRPSKG